MRYLRTTLATDWSDEREPNPLWANVLGRFAKLVLPNANPDYDGKYEKISAWLVEVDDEGEVAREIALDESGAPLFSGPDERNYGFWTDVDGAGAYLADQGVDSIAESEFEKHESTHHISHIK